MKYLKFFIAGFLFLLMLSSCGGTDSPESVVLKYFEAVDRMDFALAKTYAAKETAPAFDVLIKMAEEECLSKSQEEDSSIKVTVKSVEVSEDKKTANVVVEMVAGNGVVVDESEIHLVEEEGAWKVTLAPF